MKIIKKSIAQLPVCYCAAPLTYHGKPHFLVASEQDYPCLLFDQDGNQVAKIWEKPGGTMSMVQIPGSDGAFLAIRGFYSPDRGKDAAIYLVSDEDGIWKNKAVAQLPCLHRMDILTRGGTNWVIACCLKSGYEYDGDWRFPGKTCVCRLPDHLTETGAELPPFIPLLENMPENHGYSRDLQDGVMSGIVSCQSGTYRFTPPGSGENWTIEKICEDPASDALLIDLDGCGQKELVSILPFHGDTIAIYKLLDGRYQKIWEYEKKVPMAHAITAGIICEQPAAVIGHRNGSRDLFLITYDNGFHVIIADHDVGPANVMLLQTGNKEVLIAANREISEVAYYTFESF